MLSHCLHEFNLFVQRKQSCFGAIATIQFLFKLMSSMHFQKYVLYINAWKVWGRPYCQILGIRHKGKKKPHTGGLCGLGPRPNAVHLVWGRVCAFLLYLNFSKLLPLSGYVSVHACVIRWMAMHIWFGEKYIQLFIHCTTESNHLGGVVFSLWLEVHQHLNFGGELNSTLSGVSTNFI